MAGNILEDLPIPEHLNPEPIMSSCLREQSDRLTVGQSGDRLVYGNPEGHSILDEFRELGVRAARQEKQLNEQQRLNAEQEKINNEIKGFIQQLRLTSEGYMSTRR